MTLAAQTYWGKWEFSVRLTNALCIAEIKTMDDLLKMSDAQLLALPNFGKRSLRELKDRLIELEKPRNITCPRCAGLGVVRC